MIVASAFVQENYVDLKKDNASLPILIRECSGVEPRVIARYGKAYLYQLECLADVDCMFSVSYLFASYTIVVADVLRFRCRKGHHRQRSAATRDHPAVTRADQDWGQYAQSGRSECACPIIEVHERFIYWQASYIQHQ